MDFDIENLIRKYFWFIVDDYKFSYKDRVFSSNQLELRIALEREPPDTYLPGLYFQSIGEPDYTVLTLYWLLYYFADAKPYLNFQSKSLEENMKYVSDRLKKYSQKIFLEVDNWWLPAQKFRIKMLREQYRESFMITFKRLDDYVNEKEEH